MRLEEIIQSTLDWCNELRAKQGLEALTELPKGRLRDPFSCPCGSATNYYVGFEAARFLGSVADAFVDINLPEVVRKFVVLFDNGQLPQFEDKPT